MKQDEFQAELDRIDRERRGDPLTPEDEARIRAQERRWATESRIRHEEWAKTRGFPFHPLWLIPAFLIALPIFAGALGFLLGRHGQ